MGDLHNQLKRRRKALGLTQADMKMRVGIPRQQYQRLEANGNPRLDTLELVATGLKSEVMLIPREQVSAVVAMLEGQTPAGRPGPTRGRPEVGPNPVADNPWADLMDDDTGDKDD